MSRSLRLLLIATAILVTATGCDKLVPRRPKAPAEPTFTSTAVKEIGGAPVVHLTRAQAGDTPQFLGMTIFPGRGMNVFQITAYVPTKGKIQLLASPSFATAARTLTGAGMDENGDASYTFGGAFLIPYPNRIFGKVSADSKTITTYWQGHKMVLPANVGYGPDPTKTRDAMHGLILASKIQNVQVTPTPDGETLTGILHAGDFGGHWLSSTDLHFTIALTGPAINVTITADNVGTVPEPMSIGWHPYFAIPSGQRAQVKLYVPATMRALVNSYQVEKPTGHFQPVKGTPYDFNAPGGNPLGSLHLDDNFSHLVRDNGAVNVRITDPAASYGIEVSGLSPEIQAVQIFSPTKSHFVAVEQQFNLVDPFGLEWHHTNTGMVDLKPGDSVTWHVRLHLFTPEVPPANSPESAPDSSSAQNPPLQTAY